MAYYLKIATLEDEQILFKWRNDKFTMVNSFNVEEINYNHHKEWFRDKIQSDKSFIFLMYDDNNKEKCGQIRFDLNNNIAKISYSISESHRGNSLGKVIIKLGLIESKKYFHADRYIALVKKDNIASIKTFENLNFSKKSTEEYYEFTYPTP